MEEAGACIYAAPWPGLLHFSLYCFVYTHFLNCAIRGCSTSIRAKPYCFTEQGSSHGAGYIMTVGPLPAKRCGCLQYPGLGVAPQF